MRMSFLVVILSIILHHMYSEIQAKITAFLNHAVKVHLKTTPPDALDTIGRAELRAYCRAAWDELEAEDRSSLKEFLSAWLQYILLRLQLWKRTQ